MTAAKPKPEPKPEAPKDDWKPEGPPDTAEAGLARLREPFPPHQVSKLPKQLTKDDRNRGRCEDTAKGRAFSADGVYCGGWHARSVHLDYVGHAALTDRLLDADPRWEWAPVAWGQDGLPLRDRDGGLWIRLTVQGVTRLGYGDAQGKTGPNATKEAIGDALRNAAMRFGAALELWHRGDLHADDVEDSAPPAAPNPPQGQPPRGRPPQVEQPVDSAKRDQWWQRVQGITYLGSDGDPDSLRGAYRQAHQAGVLPWPIGDGESMTFADFLRAQAKRLPEGKPVASPEMGQAPVDNGAPEGWGTDAEGWATP